jgi:hypothetical protein
MKTTHQKWPARVTIIGILAILLTVNFNSIINGLHGLSTWSSPVIKFIMGYGILLLPHMMIIAMIIILIYLTGDPQPSKPLLVLNVIGEFALLSGTLMVMGSRMFSWAHYSTRSLEQHGPMLQTWPWEWHTVLDSIPGAFGHGL